MFKVTCQKCLAVLRLSEDRLGETIHCPACAAAIHIRAVAKLRQPAGKPVTPATVRHTCVRCGTVLETSADNIGRMEQCANCGTRLMVRSDSLWAAAQGEASAPASTAPPSPPPAASPEALERERSKVRQIVARDCGQLAILHATPFGDPEMVRLCRHGRDLIRNVQQCNKRARRLREVLSDTDPQTEHARFIEMRQHLAVLEQKIPKVQRALNSIATTLGQMIVDRPPDVPQFRQILRRLNEPIRLPGQDTPVARPRAQPDLDVVGTLWYCRVNGQAFGPTNAAGLAAWVRQGHLKLDDAVRSEEMPQWFCLRDLRELPDGDHRRTVWPGEILKALSALAETADGSGPSDGSFWRHPGAALRKAATRAGLFHKDDPLSTDTPTAPH